VESADRETKIDIEKRVKIGRTKTVNETKTERGEERGRDREKRGEKWNR
jgi:hypothetical protein